jgi:hypothetical protein
MKMEREHQTAEKLTSQNLVEASTVDLPEDNFLKVQIRSAKQKEILRCSHFLSKTRGPNIFQHLAAESISVSLCFFDKGIDC